MILNIGLRNEGCLKIRKGPFLKILCVVLILFPACSNYNFKFGNKSKKQDEKGHVVPYGKEIGQNPVETMTVEQEVYSTRMENAISIYKRAYIVWSAEQKTFLESIGSNIVALENSYKRLTYQLKRMGKYLRGDTLELINNYLIQYGKCYNSAKNYNTGRYVRKKAENLGKNVRANLALSKVEIFPPVETEDVAVASRVILPADLLKKWKTSQEALLDSLFYKIEELEASVDSLLKVLSMCVERIPDYKDSFSRFIVQYQKIYDDFCKDKDVRKASDSLEILGEEVAKTFALTNKEK
jgi:hypothetical protein